MVNHFSGVMIFARFFGSIFLICLMILCMLIPPIFFSSLPTRGFHSNFVKIKYMTGGPIGRNVVCFGSPSHFSPYSNSSPYLCFPFVGGWYAYNRSRIKCGSYFLWLQHEFSTLRFLMQPMKFVVWFPQRLDHFISFYPGFLILDSYHSFFGEVIWCKIF
jgi:hypothetical protein